MSGTVAIRRAAAADLDAVVRLRLAFERITRDSGSLGDGTPGESARRAELSALFCRDMERGRLLCWLAESGGRAIAQAALRLRGRSAEAEILNVYTEPAYRGRGIGAALVEAAIAEARALGLSRITLQPTEHSRRIYELAGFREEGRGMTLDLRDTGL